MTTTSGPWTSQTQVTARPGEEAHLCEGLHTPSAATTAVPVPPPTDLKVFRPPNPYVALGLAVSHLMTKPAFANLRFGDWSRILTGQINRNHYCFAIDGKNKIQGFVGWALTSKQNAEAWVEGRGGLASEDGRDGDCVILNAWAASTPEANRFLVAQARAIVEGKDTIYFKRHYKDGRTRPMRLRVNDFVVQHLGRQKGSAPNAEPSSPVTTDQPSLRKPSVS